MNANAFALRAAVSISSLVTPSRPYLMFSAMVVANSVGSWLTTPMCSLSQVTFTFLMSFPSTKTWKFQGSETEFCIIFTICSSLESTTRMLPWLSNRKWAESLDFLIFAHWFAVVSFPKKQTFFSFFAKIESCLSFENLREHLTDSNCEQVPHRNSLSVCKRLEISFGCYLSILWIVKPLQKLHCGGFSTSAWTNQRDGGTNLHIQVEARHDLQGSSFVPLTHVCSSQMPFLEKSKCNTLQGSPQFNMIGGAISQTGFLFCFITTFTLWFKEDIYPPWRQFSQDTWSGRCGKTRSPWWVGVFHPWNCCQFQTPVSNKSWLQVQFHGLTFPGPLRYSALLFERHLKRNPTEN